MEQQGRGLVVHGMEERAADGIQFQFGSGAGVVVNGLLLLLGQRITHQTALRT